MINREERERDGCIVPECTNGIEVCVNDEEKE